MADGRPRSSPGARRAEQGSERTEEALTLWLTGLPRAGKSTIARLIAATLRARGVKVEVLDGDAVRESLSSDLGFSREDRDMHVRRIAFVADLLSRNGVVAITAAISPYRDARDEARKLLGERFVEIYVKASVGECARRDQTGLYERALRGEIENFTGVSDPYESPPSPELVLDTERETPEESAGKVIWYLDGHTTRGS